MNLSDMPIESSQQVMWWSRHRDSFRISNMTLEAYDDPSDLLAARRLEFEAKVLSHRIAEATQSTTVAMGLDFPASPWQFFKQRHVDSWWLGWLVRRRPVRTQRFSKSKRVTLTIDRFHEFPEANIVVPPERFGKPYLYDAVRWDQTETAYSPAAETKKPRPS